MTLFQFLTNILSIDFVNVANEKYIMFDYGF